MRRHFDCTKFDADGKSDCMNAETCKNFELDRTKFEFDYVISETYKNFEFHCLNSEEHRKFDFHSTNFEFDRVKSDSEMKFEFDRMKSDSEMKFETCRNSELDEKNFSCNCRKQCFIFAFDFYMNLNRSHSIENINQT